MLSCFSIFLGHAADSGVVHDGASGNVSVGAGRAEVGFEFAVDFRVSRAGRAGMQSRSGQSRTYKRTL